MPVESWVGEKGSTMTMQIRLGCRWAVRNNGERTGYAWSGEVRVSDLAEATGDVPCMSLVGRGPRQL